MKITPESMCGSVVVLHKIILDREEHMFLQKLLKNVNFCNL